MAIKQGTRVRRDDGTLVYTWTLLDTGDTGSPALVTDEGDIDVQLIGTLGASAVAIQGSMDNSNWATITLSPTPLVVATISRAAQRALFIRPSVSGGAATGLTVIVTITPGKV